MDVPAELGRREDRLQAISQAKEKIEPQEYEAKMAKRQERSQAGRAIYRLRKQTTEPVVGIIKQAMGWPGHRLKNIARPSLTRLAPDLSPTGC
jgi:hypothetical protein